MLVVPNIANDEEKIKIFGRIEPYLTFLVVSSLDQSYVDIRNRIDDREIIITGLKEQSKNNMGEILRCNRK
jgi:hypothetical protein